MTKVVGTFLLVTISFIYHIILLKRRKSPTPNRCFFLPLKKDLPVLNTALTGGEGWAEGTHGEWIDMSSFMVVSQCLFPSMHTGERALF